MKIYTNIFKDMKKVFNALEHNLDEITLISNRDALSIREVDKSIVQVVEVDFKSGGFLEYNVGVENQLFSFNLTDFNKATKPIKSERVVIENIKDDLVLTERSSFDTRYDIRLIDKEQNDKPNIENLEWINHIEMDFNAFVEIVDKLRKIGEYIEIETNDNGVSFRAENTTINLENGNENLIKSSGNSKSKYSLDYLRFLTKMKKMFKTIKLSLDTDFPLKMELDNEIVSIKSVLAPRVSD